MPPGEDVRLRITLRGIVQGVGFRPFVYRRARRLGLRGLSRNLSGGLQLEVEGTAEATAALVEQLRGEPPTRAVVLDLQVEDIPVQGDPDFRLEDSLAEEAQHALVPPDIATCDACLQELADPADRRHDYPFTNCTDCGPRYTILDALPYDRCRTSMHRFPMCEQCAAEYADPADRRFHAQPNACGQCGPRCWLTDRHGRIHDGDPVAEAVRLLAQGQIVAVRGLGGFHLACDAANPEPVARLRERKRRPHKPFAVMAALDRVRLFARLTDPERRALQSWRRPIVLLDARPGPLASEVRGASGWIGVMLPYTPLHTRLVNGDYPALVMTSGNLRDEPIVTGNEEALTRLAGVADHFLLHDRAIRRRADDSVTRVLGGRPVPLRRSRGWVPAPLALPAAGDPVLAVGGDLKNTCCVTRGNQAFVSQHIGDLNGPENEDFLTATIHDLQRLFGVAPGLVVHDLHPDYHSTRLALELGGPRLAVQHHHAHALACLAENGWDAPALALTLDGTGYGPDGHAWGGELLAVDGLRFTRLAHLAELPLPGGELAAQQPWRMAVAALVHSLGSQALPRLQSLIPADAAAPQLLEQVAGLCQAADTWIPTSSAGRLFDAAASLLGLCHRMTFEGQAAMSLEHAAQTGRSRSVFDFVLHAPARPGGPSRIDLTPCLVQLAAVRETGGDTAAAARAFHDTVIAALVQAAEQARSDTGIEAVALTGGVLQNRLIHRGLSQRLGSAGFRVLVHRQVPPNDGGLSLGQAWAGVLSGG